MTDPYDRGAYTPQSDAPLAFDARSSRGPSARPMPVTLIISGVILILLVAAMAAFFVHSAHETPAAPAAGETIDAIKAPPPTVPEAKPVTEPGVQIGYAEGTPLPDTNGAAVAPTATPATPTAPGAPTFTKAPEAPVTRPTAAAPAPKQPIRTEEEILAAATRAKPAPTAVVPKPAPVAAKPAPVAAAPVAKPAAPAPKPITAAPKAGAPMVQIGAFSTAQLAEQSWNGVASKIPGKIAGKTLSVEKAEVDGKTLNRALVGGFASKADAQSFCDALKAQGGVCSVRN